MKRARPASSAIKLTPAGPAEAIAPLSGAPELRGPL